MNINIILALSVMLFFLSGCRNASLSQTNTYSPTPVRINIFDENCSQACWDDLRPGTSSQQDVELYFETFTQDNPESFRIGTYEAFTSFYVSEYGHGMLAYVQNDRLFDLAVYGPFQNTAREIISSLGQPNYVNLVVYMSSTVRDDYGVIYTLFYPNDGYIFELQIDQITDLLLIESNRARVCLSEEATIRNFIVAEANPIQHFAESLQQTHMSFFDTDFVNSLIQTQDVDILSECFTTSIQ